MSDALQLQTDSATGARLLRSTAGLEPYTGPWTVRQSAHLLRRTIFGPRRQEVHDFAVMSPEQAVDRLLMVSPLPQPPAAWVDEPRVPYSEADQQLRFERMNALRVWWMNQLVYQTTSIRERLVLFWHDHFATQAVDVGIPQIMYRQNQTLRQHALGNFKTLVQAITRDPAMLYYLDGRLNTSTKPNENYARELMELFTLGEGHYTENDIGEAARALTGWVVPDSLAAEFRPGRFDAGQKTFLGETGPWDDTAIIDIIFKNPQVSRFICTKLYRAFVYEVPDPAVVEGMAQTFRDGGYEIAPVLRQLLLSAHFYDETHIGAQIKGPVEFVIGVIRQLEAGAGAGRPFLVDRANALGQYLLDPPDVSGWSGYRTWISTSTLPERHDFVGDVLAGRTATRQEGPFEVDPILVALQYPEPNNIEQLIADMAATLFPFPLTADQTQELMATVLQGQVKESWTIGDDQAPARLRDLLEAMMELPEYQLA